MGEDHVQAFEARCDVFHRWFPASRRLPGPGQAEAGQEAEDGGRAGKPYDPNAVELRYKGTKLGYVPREHNKDLALLAFYGHDGVYEARVMQVDPEADPWQQVRVGLYVTDNRP